MKKRYLFQTSVGIEEKIMADSFESALELTEGFLYDIHTLYPNDIPDCEKDYDGYQDYFMNYCTLEESPFTNDEYCDFYGNMEAHGMEQILHQLGRQKNEMRVFAQTMFTEKEIDEAIEGFDKARYLYGKLYEAAEEGMGNHE